MIQFFDNKGDKIYRDYVYIYGSDKVCTSYLYVLYGSYKIKLIIINYYYYTIIVIFSELEMIDNELFENKKKM